MTTINIFIPRILANISEDYIKSVFLEMNIGNITYIDLHTRFNELNYRYSFAFITVQLFDTDMAHSILYKMNSYGRAHIPYDDRNYWEIKYFIPKEQRNTIAPQAVFEFYPEQASMSDEIQIQIEDDVANEPSWLHDTCDDWKIDICAADSDEESITLLCADLLKTQEQRDREKEFEELQREINNTVFSQRVVSW